MSDAKIERRFTGRLLDMIHEISNALGISKEDQACANGATEIILAIQELKSAAARLAVERAEFRREVESLTAERDRLREAIESALKGTLMRDGINRDGTGFSFEISMTFDPTTRKMRLGIKKKLQEALS